MTEKKCCIQADQVSPKKLLKGKTINSNANDPKASCSMHNTIQDKAKNEQTKASRMANHRPMGEGGKSRTAVGQARETVKVPRNSFAHVMVTFGS